MKSVTLKRKLDSACGGAGVRIEADPGGIFACSNTQKMNWWSWGTLLKHQSFARRQSSRIVLGTDCRRSRSLSTGSLWTLKRICLSPWILILLICLLSLSPPKKSAQTRLWNHRRKSYGLLLIEQCLCAFPSFLKDSEPSLQIPTLPRRWDAKQAKFEPRITFLRSY